MGLLRQITFAGIYLPAPMMVRKFDPRVIATYRCFVFLHP